MAKKKTAKKKATRRRQERLLTLAQEAKVREYLADVESKDQAYMYVGLMNDDPKDLTDEEQQFIGNAMWKFAKIGFFIHTETKE